MSEEAREREIAAIFARLRREVRSGALTGPQAPSQSPQGRLKAWGEAERLWPVSFARPPARRRGLRGALFQPIKLVLARLMRWYVEPAALDQRGFNEALLKIVADLEERLERLERAQPAADRLPEP